MMKPFLLIISLRTAGKRSDRWTGQMAKMLSDKKRMYMKEFVEKKGFDKK